MKDMKSMKEIINSLKPAYFQGSNRASRTGRWSSHLSVVFLSRNLRTTQLSLRNGP